MGAWGPWPPEGQLALLTDDKTASPVPQIFEILAKTPYGHERKGLLGIDQLLAQGVFRAAFPLHDVSSGVP